MADPKIGLALGAGAARGLAHISIIEVLDDYGIVPSRIAGTSIGALYGAARASGISGAEIREFTLEATKDVGTMVDRFWQSSRPRSFKEFFDEGISIQLNALDVVKAFVPDALTRQFEDMVIPFSAVATDYFHWKQRVFSSGDVILAIAASISIPSVFKPVRIDDNSYLDGYITNPVPIGLAGEGMDFVIAIDVNGTPDIITTPKSPSAIDVAMVASQIMQNSLTAQAVELYKPDIYIKPDVRPYQSFNFDKTKEILAAGDREKDNLKRALDKMLG